MPLDKTIKKVLVLGSGGIRIGQSAEFDYSGIQALKALKEEGIKTVLINPNIATIQTSNDFADVVYLEPVTPDFVEKIIEKERPDAILLGFGGQTALNCGVRLAEMGVYEKHGIRVLGTPIGSIVKTEDREKFRQAMLEAEAPVPSGRSATTVPEALEIAGEIGYPVIIRPAYTLGGLGSSVSWGKKELEEAASMGLRHSMIGQVLAEKYLHHWKEIEYEVVRDAADNCITVCNMENLDPMGIHTGDSIVVAPSQTLTNSEYHMLRSAAIRVIRKLGIVGECNIQFALDPKSQKFYVIEVNARLSRSSALASKATGYPLAYIAAKVALGYILPELANKVTGITTACFEPAMDYIVVKVPRWEFGKFNASTETGQRRIGSQMQSIGEAMAIGRSFEEAIQKAVRCLELGREIPDGLAASDKELLEEIERPTDARLFAVAEALSRGIDIEKIHALSGIDRWFLNKLKNIADFRKQLSGLKISDKNFSSLLTDSKKLGFSDPMIAKLLKTSEVKIRKLRHFYGIRPSVKQIDTMAAEWPARTNYLYFTYHGSSDDAQRSRKSVLVIGSGPIRIGSSVEFDWCTMSSVFALREKGFRTIVANCNPETVSTDYDMSDILYFEELTLERVLDIIEKERPFGVLLSAGGQTANNLAFSLAKRGVRLLGTSGKRIDMAEDRKKFSALLDRVEIKQPAWKSLTSLEGIKSFAESIGYPVIIRPSYVLSGTCMKVAGNEKELGGYIKHAAKVSRDYPVVVSKFIQDAKEIEVDGLADGESVFIGAVIEHLENAGVHSGDACMVLPPVSLEKDTAEKIKDYTERIAKSLRIKGPFNIQYLVKDREVLVIECNLRASRSMPFVSKAIGVNIVKLATRCILGEKLTHLGPLNWEEKADGFFAVKMPMFSWSRLRNVDPVLGVEMRSTGEVACIGKSFHEAFLKSLLATEQQIDFTGSIHAKNLSNAMHNRLQRLGFEINNGVSKILIDLSEKESPERKAAASKGSLIITRPEFAEAFISALESGPELEPISLQEAYNEKAH
ncbi:MAG: carbamoyl-phosphate synthase (glutamine-hydrolyzing) large subunit [Candidatus Aenigmarchaeota archaeon]|nr:carbamoyl-phosphate synthase (glutamine-hydrolyzing) large subunit [Candidatus Aenigmarchaeota archaeon]